LVEHLTLIAKRKLLKKTFKNWPTVIAQMVKHSTTDLESEGLNPAAAQHKTKTTTNKFCQKMVRGSSIVGRALDY
jgi:hypothetical protein